uniref:Spindle pole body component n=1 Tax=Calcidiscus leptoporus TaxID=127549 RepID=A0A7S0NR59_9EUKA
MAGDEEGVALYDYLLERASVPFFEMLGAWLYRGVCSDPYGDEFMVRELPQMSKEELTTDFNCAYWQRRFLLAREQVPAFLEPLANTILDCGKYLHIVRECGQSPSNPAASRTPLQYSADHRKLRLAIEAAREWASALVLELMIGEQRLMARLASIKHYFLLDQGDFFVHFLDSAEEELVKPVSQISRGRLHSKLELSLRQAAISDPYKESLSCDLLPYNLTNQLLRIINAARATATPHEQQQAERTPGLDAFTFDYKVQWPLSLVLSKNAITKYQLLFRHLFHCKHVERQLSSSWLSQQEGKALPSAVFSSSYGLRQRMLHFLQNIEYYMMFEVLEPNWHMLKLRLQAARRVDELISHHQDFLDVCLKECMLRDAVLLKLLAKLLTICVIFADQTRLVMGKVSEVLALHPLDTYGPRRREQRATLMGKVEDTISGFNHYVKVQKLGARFDEELRRLLEELRKQAHKEWNLAHLCSRLDYNNYWQQYRLQ